MQSLCARDLRYGTPVFCQWVGRGSLVTATVNDCI